MAEEIHSPNQNQHRSTTIYWVSEQKTGFPTQSFGNKATDAFKGEPSYKPSSKLKVGSEGSAGMIITAMYHFS